MSKSPTDTDTLPGPSDPVDLSIDAATLELLSQAQMQYGNLVRFGRSSAADSIFVNDPDIVQQVLIKEHRRYDKGRDFERVKMLLGNGIIVSDGEVWRRHRRMMQPAFTRRSIDQLLGSVTKAIAGLNALWQAAADANDTIDLTADTNRFALEAILRAIFGDDYDHHFANAEDNPFAFLSQEFARDLRVVTRLRGVRKEVQEIINARKATEDKSEDFLSSLIHARDKNGEGLTDKEVIDEVMTLVVAGFETTAGTLNWAWFEISRHAGIEAAVLSELTASDKLDATVLSELALTRAVLDETLRLYPPVWLYSREANEDDVYQGVPIRKGTHIYISPYLLQRSACFWNKPGDFDPGRFLNDNESIVKGSYIPFSLGPRRCIGEYFSFMEMQLALKYLLPRFELRPVVNAIPELDLGINLRSKDPIVMTIKHRRDANV
ncbi:MAG: cytochrome P450 [Pseudomonadota bacterium]